ncbi:isochorismatase family protein [Gordonia oryzae]|uniref:Isochorismatase family protein n=1 Tax=Gordonia oryzae TaxID=2487349 RepID=A0A3N4GKG7_9ACTN|nr:isochorismatase family protein [Gordonia oryzae]RPA61076.1 isochorismatase family protein [Gordonia oryzae]
MSDTRTLDPATTAFLLIGVPKEFTSDGGVLHDAVAEVMDKTSMRTNTTSPTPAGRGDDHARPGHLRSRLRRTHATPVQPRQGRRRRQRCREGHLGAQIVHDVAPANGDIFIEGKHGLNTCASTDADFIRRSKGIETATLAGLRDNHCAESTMRSAYDHGYRMITLTDCSAATSVAEHDNAISFDYPTHSHPGAAADVRAAL